MKSNNLRNILVLILIIILGFAAYFMFGKPHSIVPSETATTTLQEVKPDLNQGVEVQAETVTDRDEQKKYEINASYPYISGLKDTSVQKKINGAIEKTINAEMDNFKLSESDGTVEIGMPTGTSTLDINFARITNAPGTNIISFSIAEEMYSVGAAHPAHNYLSLNYDLKSGKKLALSDLFTGDYVNVLSQKSIAALKAKMGQDANDEYIESGAGPKAENFSVFFPTSQGFKVLFNEYKVAAYVAGPQEITIPFAELRAVINQSGLLKDL
jgi:hypothetical protein